MNCSSQGNYIVIYYDKDLEILSTPQMVSVTSWKSTKLKYKTKNILPIKWQTLIIGIGPIHWYRFLLLELNGKNMSDR